MKIVYMHQYFRTPEMGGGTRSYEFARRLVERGHQVEVITAEADVSAGTSARRGRWRSTMEAGIVVHWAPVPYNNTMPYRQRIASFGRFARAASARAVGLEQDVVLASSTPLTIAIPGVYSARKNGVPMVLEVRDLWPEVPIALGALRSVASKLAALELEKWAYRNATRIIALSPDMAANIKSKLPNAATTVIPNAADVEVFDGGQAAAEALRRTLPWLGHRPLMLYAGTLGMVNGVDYIVRMAARTKLLAPEVRFAIVGSGREEGLVRRLAEELGVLNSNLFMLNPVSKSEVAAYFGACDLAFSTVIDVPQLSANSANKVFDAWAAGKPVAINHGGWIAKLILETGAGIVLPAGDPGRAAVDAVGFINDPSRSSAARVAAKDLAYERFSRDRLFEKFEGVVLSAIDAHRRAGDRIATSLHSSQN